MNKLSPKILFPIVIAIWAVVIWRFVRPEDVGPPSQAYLPARISEQDTMRWQETLHLDYPDPFLGSSPRVVTSTTTQPVSEPRVRVVRPTKTWSLPNLVYRGGVRNESSVTGILQYDGREMMVRAGDSIPGIRILEMDLNSITMRMRDSVVRIYSK